MQLAGLGLQIHAQARFGPRTRWCELGMARAGKLATVFRSSGQIAAIAQNARRAALAALEAQFGDVQSGALQLGAQNAVAQVHAIEQGHDVEPIGLDIALPLWVLQGAADAGIRRQAALNAPARWRKQGPQPHIWHIGMQLTGQRRCGG